MRHLGVRMIVAMAMVVAPIHHGADLTSL